MILAKLALGIGAGRVEVPQPDRCNPVGAFEVRQRVLDGQFGLAVSVDRAVGWFSLSGVSIGSPYTAQVEEKSEMAAAFGRHRLERREVPTTLLR
jgi:hypothetical protein